MAWGKPPPTLHSREQTHSDKTSLTLVSFPSSVGGGGTASLSVCVYVTRNATRVRRAGRVTHLYSAPHDGLSAFLSSSPKSPSLEALMAGGTEGGKEGKQSGKDESPREKGFVAKLSILFATHST